MNAKNLHKHSLPVIGLLMVVFVVSLLVANRLAEAGGQGALAGVLGTRLVRVEPTANGLARVHINQQRASAALSTAVDPAATSEFQAVGDNSGQLARLSFVVEALNPTGLTNPPVVKVGH